MSTVFVVRHAKAEARRSFDGPDRARPLTKAGRRQARALIDLLGHEKIARVVSSPHVRCRETVGPLAEHLGIVVELDAALAEGAGFDPVLELVLASGASGAAGAVLCSHGDVIGDLLGGLERHGTALPDDGDLTKGSTWALDVADGAVVAARYLPPPSA